MKKKLAFGLRVVLSAIALLLAFGLFAKAALDVSWPWDVWYYHLPFAARIWGILPRDLYSFTSLNEARFHGYPLLAETLQGLLWRIFGRPEAANFVALGSLALLVVYAQRRFAVPLYISTIALLAVPHVQMHATSCYIDLPANAALAVVVLEAMRAFAVAVPSARAIAVIVVASAITANMRLQLEPIVLVALVAIATRLLRAGALRDPALRRRLVALVVLAPLVFAWPVKNLLLNKNPAYPIALHVMGHDLPSAEEPYDSAPPYLETRSRPYRWVVSLAEVGIQPLTESHRWTIDQYMPPDSKGNRIGGFFGAYVAANVLLFLAQVGLALRRKDAASRHVHLSMAGTLGLLSLVCAFLPQSHELRYYMVWMIALVLGNLVLLVTTLRDVQMPIVALGALGFLAVVLWSTEGWHVTPARYSLAQLVADKVDPALFGQIKDGSVVCIDRAPWIALYAAPFHPGRSYRVQEAETAGDCGQLPLLGSAVVAPSPSPSPATVP